MKLKSFFDKRNCAIKKKEIFVYVSFSQNKGFLIKIKKVFDISNKNLEEKNEINIEIFQFASIIN